jgi:hypothetical protein
MRINGIELPHRCKSANVMRQCVGLRHIAHAHIPTCNVIGIAPKILPQKRFVRQVFTHNIIVELEKGNTLSAVDIASICTPHNYQALGQYSASSSKPCSKS